MARSVPHCPRMRLALLVLVVGCSASPVGQGTPPKWVEDTSVPAAPSVKPPPFRLPGDVRPVRYDLDLTIIPSAAKATGKVHVAARVVRPTRVVWLHAQGSRSERPRRRQPARIVTPRRGLVGLVAVDRARAPASIAIDIAFTTAIDRSAAAACTR